MRVFISEYICGGGWPDGCPQGSLRAEGEAMLAAAIADFTRIPGCQVVTTWDSRLGSCRIPSVEVMTPAPPECSGPDCARDEGYWFERIAASCDATLVIAPEFAGLLAERSAIVERCGRRLLGCSSDVVRACGDKLGLSRVLRDADIPAVACEMLRAREEWDALPYPIVVKPRHGTGAINTFLVRRAEDLRALFDAGFDPPELPADVWQPFVRGRSLSVAALVSDAGRQIEVFPVGEQDVSHEPRGPWNIERFAYHGGRIPAAGCRVECVEGLARRACKLLGAGVRGYVGFDLLLPEEEGRPLLILEVNPRLTTSYVGYRALTTGNLATCLLDESPDRPPLEWLPEPVEFTAMGTVRPSVR